ncbi:MAG: hypothetical protein IT186_17905 [Acidobacteria bacterium]|nr:hypothetical protein [Acidobacteriota bacterium]
MKHPRIAPISLVPLLIATVTACTRGDTVGRLKALNVALMPFGETAIPTGKLLKLKNDTLVFLKEMEAAGLVSVKEIPQDYWGDFASRTFMEGARPYDVNPTPKLQKLAQWESDPAGHIFWRLQIAKVEVGDVVRDEKYSGVLASPGEECWLVLANLRHKVVFKEQVGPHLQLDLPGRVRSVLKYSPFNKTWSVVALDVGPSASEQWNTSNVK